MLKSHPKRVLIAMGSNASNDLKESHDLLVDALKSLTSRFYKTPAFPAESGPDFINCVLSGKTYLSPEHLLNKMHLIEEDFGRTRMKRWGQRTLDIDLLDFDNNVIPSGI